jgi:hypothetical protein
VVKESPTGTISTIPILAKTERVKSLLFFPTLSNSGCSLLHHYQYVILIVNVIFAKE